MDREAWNAAVDGVAKVRYEWVTELIINNLDEFKDTMLGDSIYVKFKNKPNKSIVMEKKINKDTSV